MAKAKVAIVDYIQPDLKWEAGAQRRAEDARESSARDRFGTMNNDYNRRKCHGKTNFGRTVCGL